MKNILSVFLLIITLIIPLKGLATDEVGDPAKVWTYPVVYALDEEVTWFFDMSGTTFSEGMDLYLWAWSPSEPDAGNFDNSSEFAKLEYVGNMVWKKTLIPTSYFGMSVASIENSAGFWMRLKGKGNELQSGVIQAPWSVSELKTFSESGNAVQIFPEKFYLDSPLSILVNPSKLWVGGRQGEIVDGAEVFMHSGLNNFAEGAIVEANMGDPALMKKTKLKRVGPNLYKMDMTPREYYGVGEDFVMTNIECLFPTRDWAQVGMNEAGNFIFYAPEAIIPPDPVFSFFPQKFTIYDILTLIRINNEASSKGLEYTITAGDKVISGDFAGSKTEMKAYINLLNELEGVSTTIEKITLSVKDKNGASIVQTDIPLIPISEVE